MIFDHLITSLHFQAFVLLWATILCFASNFIGAGWAIAAFFLWRFIYIYKIHRVVYAHGRFSSMLRTLMVDSVYAFVLLLSFAVLMSLGVLFV